MFKSQIKIIYLLSKYLYYCNYSEPCIARSFSDNSLIIDEWCRRLH